MVNVNEYLEENKITKNKIVEKVSENFFSKNSFVEIFTQEERAIAEENIRKSVSNYIEDPNTLMTKGSVDVFINTLTDVLSKSNGRIEQRDFNSQDISNALNNQIIKDIISDKVTSIVGKEAKPRLGQNSEQVNTQIKSNISSMLDSFEEKVGKKFILENMGKIEDILIKEMSKESVKPMIARDVVKEEKGNEVKSLPTFAKTTTGKDILRELEAQLKPQWKKAEIDKKTNIKDQNITGSHRNVQQSAAKDEVQSLSKTVDRVAEKLQKAPSKLFKKISKAVLDYDKKSESNIAATNTSGKEAKKGTKNIS